MTDPVKPQNQSELLSQIEHADDGFTVRPHIDEFWNASNVMGRLATVEKLRRCEATRRIYFTKDGGTYPIGARVMFTSLNEDGSAAETTVFAEGWLDDNGEVVQLRCTHDPSTRSGAGAP